MYVPEVRLESNQSTRLTIYFPVECFDTGRAELLQEGEAERLECREAFLRLLEISKAVAFKNPTAEWARLCNMEEVTTESSGN